MSVQAGICNFDGGPVDRKLIAQLSECMSQQGLGNESIYVDGSVAMLYRPFHTTAESRRENQPYLSQGGSILTWDGRLDNRNDLVCDLRSDLDSDPTDIEIVAAGFDRCGSDFFHRLIGDWAVSIWKSGQRELIFACDYMAVRHIFYYLKKDRVWWATDLAPLVLLSGDKFHVDDEYMAGYFADEPDAHLTPYREIREVPPGRIVRIRNGCSSTVEFHWRFSRSSPIRYKTDTEYEEHFRHVFRQSVRRRLRSDSPMLAELSGGLDSSSIVCMADDVLAKEGAQTPRLDTLSYYDKTEPAGEDWMYFRIVEEKRRKTGIHIDASKYGKSSSFAYPEFSPLPGYLGAGRELDVERASAIRRGGYRAVLCGLGGDEFMGGIPDPSANLADLIVQFKLVRLAKDLFAWSLVKQRPMLQLLWHALVDLLPVCLGQCFVEHAKVESWIQAQFAARTKIAIRRLRVDQDFGLQLPTRRSYLAGAVMMANKLAKSKPPMLALEETRYPYLDQSLIEFILSIPASQLLRPGERRSLMRRALAGFVPREVLERRTKQFGARTPIVAIEHNWEELITSLDSHLSEYFGYVNHRRFLETLRAAKNGKQVHLTRVLRTISLEFWLRDLVARGLFEAETGSLQPFAKASLNQSA